MKNNRSVIKIAHDFFLIFKF